MIIPRYYEDLNVLHENTMPSRAYYIPTSRRIDNLVFNRELSDRVLFLNGTWKFKFFPSVVDLDEEFYKDGYDFSDFDDILVPGNWQIFGYDNFQYTNITYPFPFDPPYVPIDNPCGAYICEFDYKKDDIACNAFLNFEGVDSCFYVWINGQYVGYSQVSHTTSEFDVSKFLYDGKNTIAVLVLKWCDGSYLEDQDKFRLSGIFRDVYIIKRPNYYIRDYFITTKINDDNSFVCIDVDDVDVAPKFKFILQNCNGYVYEDYDIELKYKFILEDCDGNVVDECNIINNGRVVLSVKNPILWNAENPYLYTLIIESEYETIVDYVGFRKLEIIDSVFYLNGQNVKFYGVNRHDSDPVTGSTISFNQVLSDLMIMKKHNINAIRCSHYPNSPYFYQLCDLLGFMVIDEADIEAHGPFLLYRKEDTLDNRNKLWGEMLADNPLWENAFVDRVSRMIMRDKNRPCIVIWSMGNECAYGCNFEKALEWTKEYDSTRFTQYESARYRNYDKTYNFDNIDFYSRMYPSIDEIKDYINRDASKPFLMIEYSHSMGNGPGDLEDYFEVIESNDICCGGFVWEWCDHAIFNGVADNGKKMYYYGGDHGEKIHDGNFCIDGLVLPDRTVHTGLLELRNVFRKARVVSFDMDTLTIVFHNYMDFLDLKDYVRVSYSLICDEMVLYSGDLDLLSILPHCDGVCKLPFKKSDIPQKGKVYLLFRYRMINEKRMVTYEEKVDGGRIVGYDEVRIYNDSGVNLNVSRLFDSNEKVNEALDNIMKLKDYCIMGCVDKNVYETKDLDNNKNVYEIKDLDNNKNVYEIKDLDNNKNVYETKDLDNNKNVYETKDLDNDKNVCETKEFDNDKNGYDIKVFDNDNDVKILGRDFSYVYNKKNGMFDSFCYKNKEYFNHPTQINIWRAPTDNDMHIKKAWKSARFHECFSRAYSTDVYMEDEYVKIVTNIGMVAAGIQKILDACITWTIDKYGAVYSSIKVVKDKEFETLPRFGLRLFLDKEFSNIIYYGMGPYESYCDKHRASWHGFFKYNIHELKDEYIRPQENNSHYDCDYVLVSSKKNCGIAAVAKQSFSFNASFYTQEELERAAHNFELIESDSTVFCLDYKMNGIGSNSCGPELNEKYRFDDVEFEFNIKLIPYMI